MSDGGHHIAHSGHPDDHDDLIGVTVPLLDGSECYLIVTGTSANPAYVDVEKRNQHGDFIGRSCRPAAHVRPYLNERTA